MGKEVAGQDLGGEHSVPTLKSKRVTLRAPRPSDIEDKLAIGRHPEIVRMFGGDSDFTQPTREGMEAWYERLSAHGSAWIIDYENRAIGEVRLHSVDHHDRRARIAVGIGDPNLLGLGLGTEAIKLAVAYGFDTLQLNRIDLRVIEYNTRAIRAYEKCGFVIEGRERQAANVDGEWFDDVMMSILADEYRARDAGVSR